jgi:two-component system sensor histidine kinase KdpD
LVDNKPDAESNRPDPDELLERVTAEEKQAKRGRLKIFLGYAAGVGKTYSMLEAAHQIKNSLDTVVGVVETHGRNDTKALLTGLEIIPGRQLEYHNILLTEMDLNAILNRHPQLVLVDELAHENIPDSRHPKRYQDVEEILQAGIDVYTTLNIQHVESLRGVVAEITGVWVRESVPDSILDEANEIELVDLPPDELIKRLKEGKVYVPEQIAFAVDKFFRKGNLLALRELAMRTASRHIDEATLEYMKVHGIHGPWSSRERLLVCVSPDSTGTHLIRAARRLSYELAAEWSVLNIVTPENDRLPAERKDQITNTIRLAQRLGAKTVNIRTESTINTCIGYAQKNNITKIIASRPSKKSKPAIFRKSLAEELVHRVSDIDVYIVSGGETVKARRPEISNLLGDWRGYLYSTLLVGFITVLAYLVKDLFTPVNLVMLYLLCVGITAVLWGFGASILVSILGVLAFDFFFVPPFLTFTVDDTEYIITFFVLLLVGIAISYLMRRIRQQERAAVKREEEMSSLYTLSRDLAASNNFRSYVQAIVEKTKATFGQDTVIYLPFKTGWESLKPYVISLDVSVEGNEMAAAIWSFQHNKVTGRGTDTLPNATARYIPLSTARGTVGILSLSTKNDTKQLTMDQERLLEAFADLAAVAIEGIQRAEEAYNAQVMSQVLKDTEKLQTALLNSISHDLRTPLVSIIGVFSSLQEERMNLDEIARKNMIQVGMDEAERLNRLITNLLDVSRIEAGALKINKQPTDLQELVGSALAQIGNRGILHPVKLDLPLDLPTVWVDSSLMVQALANILDNAIKYSPEGSPIEIRGEKIDKRILLEIADRGIGIPERDLVHVFEKFYRVRRPDKISGTGLGLSICKGIIEAHGGFIVAQNRVGGGTVIRINLPIGEPKQEEKTNG